MDKLKLDIRITGCPNKCFHCHCYGGDKTKVFFSIDKIIRIASFFREKLNTDVLALLLDEQTYYPNFFNLIAVLEAEGFMRKTSSKFLVTNCWGLSNVPGFVDKMKEHYNMVVPTLFGIDETHDMLSGRKGSYNDIIKATKECIEKGIEVMWHLIWTRNNTDEINRLYEIGKSMGVTNIGTSGEFYFSGYFTNQANKYLPVFDNFQKMNHEVAEHKQGLLKTAGQLVDDIKNGVTYDVKKVSFDELYVDEKLNVYPLMHLSEEFCLGNIDDSPNSIIEQIQTDANLPEAIINKRKQDFSELVLQYADLTSNQLYTPQSLFENLYFNKVT